MQSVANYMYDFCFKMWSPLLVSCCQMGPLPLRCSQHTWWKQNPWINYPTSEQLIQPAMTRGRNKCHKEWGSEDWARAMRSPSWPPACLGPRAPVDSLKAPPVGFSLYLTCMSPGHRRHAMTRQPILPPGGCLTPLRSLGSMSLGSGLWLTGLGGAWWRWGDPRALATAPQHLHLGARSPHVLGSVTQGTR